MLWSSCLSTACNGRSQSMCALPLLAFCCCRLCHLVRRAAVPLHKSALLLPWLSLRHMHYNPRNRHSLARCCGRTAAERHRQP